MEEDDEYFTHPDKMRGATGRKQNAMMHQQLKSFETMLNTFLERHETSSLYRALARIIPHNRQVCSLQSLNQYTNQWYSDRGSDAHIDDHTIIKRIEEFNQEIQYLKQMKTMFDDRIYSVLFEFYYEMVMEEIPQATKSVERGRLASSEVQGSNLLVMSNTEGYAALNKSMPVEKFYDISKDCKKMFDIIHQLQQIDVRWGSLLKSEDTDVELFDPDSVHDVKKYPNYLRFEAVLRLIPDVIRKSQNAIELSKSWWYQAERIRRRLRGQKIREDTTSDQALENDDNQITESLQEDEPTTEQVIKGVDSTKQLKSLSNHRPEAAPDHHNEYTKYQDPTYRRKGRACTDTDEDRNCRLNERIPYNSVDSSEDRPPQSRATLDSERIIPRQSYPAVTETVERRLRELSTSIALGQLDLAAETNELEFFNRRQQRIKKLRSNLKRAINAMEAMHDELKGYRREKEQLLFQLEDVVDLSERRHITGKLKTLDDKVKEVQELSQVIEYRHKLITSDLKLELDLKETFTRYQHEVRDRVDLLKSSVQEDEDSREQLSHELRLLRLQAGLDESDHSEDSSDDTKYMYNKVNPNFPDVSKSRPVPRVPHSRIGDIPWLGNGSQSLDDSYQVNGELENRDRESFSPDLLDGQLLSVESARWDREGLSGDRKHLNQTASSPELLNRMRPTSVDSGVLNPDNTVRQRDSKCKPKLKRQIPKKSRDTSDFDSSKDIPNRSSNTTQNKRIAVPEINYFPPSPIGKKRHRKPKALEKSLSNSNREVDDPFGYNGYNSRQKNSHQDTDHPDNSMRDRDEGRNMEQRRRPSAPSVNSELPTRNQQRQTRQSLGRNKKGAPIKKQPPLPQLREEDDSSSAPAKGRTPRMYDPKRESLDSVFSFYSPMLLNSYTPLSFEHHGKEELHGADGSTKAKKTQRLKPKKSHQTDLLSPVNKPNQTHRSKQTQSSRIPVKTSYRDHLKHDEMQQTGHGQIIIGDQL